MYAFTQFFERNAQSESRAQRIAVGFDVADHDEGGTLAQFGDHFFGRRGNRLCFFDHALPPLASRSVLLKLMARSVERSSTNCSSGVWRSFTTWPNSPRRD